MSSVGSFGTFTTARLAIYVANKGLSVTGNNIANINTPGYTRQRLDQVSFKTGKSDHYQSRFDTHVGNGAIPQAVSQLRDPYLDIRYRTEHSSEGFYNGKLEGLQDIKAFLDETGKGDKDGDGLLYAEFRNFFDALKHIEVGAGTEVNDTLALNSGDALCALFQSAADQLVTLKTNTESRLRQEVDDINDILTSIRGLNVSIRQAEIHGDGALELRDQRNLLIDDLSEKIKIDVTYTMEDIGLDREVEKLSIRLGNANPDDDVKSDSSLLVDGGYCAQLTTPLANEKYVPLYDTTSEAYQKAVELLKENEAKGNTNPIEVDDGLGNKVQFTTVKQLDDAIDAMLADPAQAIATFRYLDENGEPTNDPRDAKQVFDEHYNITVSDLRDKNYEAWEDYGKPKVTTPTNQNDFPTRAKYSGTISYSGTWKDGDEIDVDGTKIVIGKDISADDANNEPKNVANAIRDALVKGSGYRDKTTNEMLCNISTTTKKNPDGSVTIDLNISTKAAGADQKIDYVPTISVKADAYAATGGNVTVGAPTLVADSKPSKYTLEVKTEDTWNKGDEISLDTTPPVKLVVGKDISVNGAKNPATLASALSRKIQAAGAVEDGFNISYTTDKKNGTASLVLTAQDPTNTKAPGGITATVTPPTAINPTNPLTTNSNDDGTAGDANPPINLNPEDEVIDNLDNTTSRMHTYYTIDENDKWHKVTMEIRDSKTKVLDDNDMFGRLQAVREQLTEEGEFSSPKDIELDESASIKRGIPYYQQTLDLLARKFAETMNEANTGFAVDQNGNYLTSNDGGKTFEKIMLDNEPLNKNELTTNQKKIIEDNALTNFVKANFAGFVKNADGTDSNVLADKYGNPLKLGSMQLTKENLTFKDDKGDPVTDPTFPINFESVAFKDENAVPDTAKADLNEQAVDSYLEVNQGYKMGGNLFSNRGDTDDAFGITASNISVAHSWSEGNIHVVPTYIKLFDGDVPNTTQQDNALHMSNLIDRDLVYNPQDLVEDALSTHLFSGSFQDMFVKMNTTLGNDMHSTQITLETHAGRALDIDTSRDSVSAVDLNDEAMGLMQYSHSLNAAYRLMTTLDDMLERLITGTGVTR